ncbi:MAG: hypothetical protein JSV19_05550, partial [Phycisphaerales bacterium]
LFCNGADTCAGGTCSQHAGDPCVGGGECADACNETADNCYDPAGTACTDDSNVCTDNECDGAGTCIAVTNTDPCDDGLFCNGADTCSGGTCSQHAGDPCVGGSECADACNETANNCYDPAGTVCTDDGNVCTDNECDGSGACIAINNTAPCDDADACTVGGVCSNGICVGGPPPDCSTAGDQCNSASCDPLGSEGNCDILTPINEGLPCDDGDVCLIGETCQSGTCAGGIGPDCSTAGDQCNSASCDPLGGEGNCDTLTPVNEGLPCDDGDVCLIGETCQGGTCTGGIEPDCSASGDQCNDASCDTNGLEGNCDTLTPINEGLPCDDGDVCLIGETCQGGACAGGIEPDCLAYDDQCNDASCDPLGDEGNCDTLTPTNEGLPCDDGDVCLIGETCQSGTCTGGIEPDCSAYGDQCNDASCDPLGDEGNCDILAPANEGLPCDDTLFCTAGETCQAGDCTGGTDPCVSGQWCNEDAGECVNYGNGDFEPDGDVDLFDFAAFQVCFGQDGFGACAPGNLTGGDAAIDLVDFAEFEALMTGP